MTTDAPSTPRSHPGRPVPMRLLVTGGSGALGRALVPLAAAAGHQPVLPTHDELDLFDVCGDGERVSNRRCSQAVGWHPDR